MKQNNPYEVAEFTLDFLEKNGKYMNEYIVKHNGGKAVRNITDNQIRLARYRVRKNWENEIRHGTLKRYFPRWARVKYQKAMESIGHHLYKGQTFFRLLDQCELVDKYMRKGLDVDDIIKLDRHMESKGISSAQRKRIKESRDVREKTTGFQAVERKYWEQVAEELAKNAPIPGEGGFRAKGMYFAKRSAVYGKLTFPKWGSAAIGDAFFTGVTLFVSGERDCMEYYKHGTSIAVATAAAWGTETLLLASGMSATVGMSSTLATLSILSPVPICGQVTVVAGAVYLGVRWGVCAGWDAYALAQRERIEAECRQAEREYVSQLRVKMINQNTHQLKELLKGVRDSKMIE